MFFRRAANRGLWINFSMSQHVKNIHLKINRIQIDNQLPDHIFDVILSPVIVPKSVYDKFEIEQKSFIEFSAIIQSNGAVSRYKYVQLLIQEFMIQVDWGWVCLLMNVFNLENSKEDTPDILIAKELDVILDVMFNTFKRGCFYFFKKYFF